MSNELIITTMHCSKQRGWYVICSQKLIEEVNNKTGIKIDKKVSIYETRKEVREYIREFKKDLKLLGGSKYIIKNNEITVPTMRYITTIIKYFDK